MGVVLLADRGPRVAAATRTALFAGSKVGGRSPHARQVEALARRENEPADRREAFFISGKHGVGAHLELLAKFGVSAGPRPCPFPAHQRGLIGSDVRRTVPSVPAIVCLNGTHGVGKTTTAALAAASSRTRWSSTPRRFRRDPHGHSGLPATTTSSTGTCGARRGRHRAPRAGVHRRQRLHAHDRAGRGVLARSRGRGARHPVRHLPHVERHARAHSRASTPPSPFRLQCMSRRLAGGRAELFHAEAEVVDTTHLTPAQVARQVVDTLPDGVRPLRRRRAPPPDRARTTPAPVPRDAPTCTARPGPASSGSTSSSSRLVACSTCAAASVRVSSPQGVYFPSAPTKLDVQYLAGGRRHPGALPDRPTTLERYPAAFERCPRDLQWTPTGARVLPGAGPGSPGLRADGTHRVPERPDRARRGRTQLCRQVVAWAANLGTSAAPPVARPGDDVTSDQIRIDPTLFPYTDSLTPRQVAPHAERFRRARAWRAHPRPAARYSRLRADRAARSSTIGAGHHRVWLFERHARAGYDEVVEGERGQKTSSTTTQMARDRTIASAPTSTNPRATKSALAALHEVGDVHFDDFDVTTMPARFGWRPATCSRCRRAPRRATRSSRCSVRRQQERDEGHGDLPYPPERLEDARRRKHQPSRDRDRPPLTPPPCTRPDAACDGCPAPNPHWDGYRRDGACPRRSSTSATVVTIAAAHRRFVLDATTADFQATVNGGDGDLAAFLLSRVLGDRPGRRRAFLVGVTGRGSSPACACADRRAARCGPCLQGVGALSRLGRLHHPGRRSRARIWPRDGAVVRARWHRGGLHLLPGGWTSRSRRGGGLGINLPLAAVVAVSRAARGPETLDPGEGAAA